MNKALKEIFNQIYAEEELKNHTKQFISQESQRYVKTRTRYLRFCAYAATCACFLLLLVTGRWLYFTPTTEISIDINPSIELSVNRFDRIISINGLNDDGQKLTNTLDIKFRNYTDAIDRILKNENIAALLSDNEIMTITVTGPDKTQSTRVLSNIEVCTAAQKNTYCYSASSEEIAAAHEMGLSCGKYKIFLEIQALDPGIRPEIIQNMTMRELRDLLDRLSADNEKETLPDDRENETPPEDTESETLSNHSSCPGQGDHGQQGSGNGHRQNHGNGRKRGLSGNR